MSEPSQPTPQPPVPPVPQYGEYAPAGYVAATPAPAPAGYPMYPAPTGRRRKTWDMVLTIVLLVLALFGMLLGLFYAALLPQVLDEAYRQQGLGDFTGDTGAAGPVIVISHIVLFLIAVGGAIPLLLTKRVAFWVPLTAGVIATVIFWSTFVGIFLSDPAFVSNVR